MSVMKIRVYPHTCVVVEGDDKTLDRWLRFRNHNVEYDERYQMGMRDEYEHLYDATSRRFPIGMLSRVKNRAKAWGVDLELKYIDKPEPLEPICADFIKVNTPTGPAPLRNDQVRPVNALLTRGSGAAELPTGCHSKGHPILMFDGSVKAVEQVTAGDKVLGPDANPRTVQFLCGGRDILYKISPRNMEPFYVNAGHILSLMTKSGKVFNTSVKTYLSDKCDTRYLYTVPGILEKSFERKLVRFDIKPVKEGKYYGFCLDGDHLYLDGNHIVHHNSGKTAMSAALVGAVYFQTGGKSLIMVPKKGLLDQTHKDMRDMLGESMSVGKVGGGFFEPDRDLVVATPQTLQQVLKSPGESETKRRKWKDLRNMLNERACLILDECFVAGTLVDGKPIEEYKAGDYVNAYDHNNGRMVKRKVAMVYTSVPSALLCLKIAGKKDQIVTPAHPYFTYAAKGYIQAVDLCGEDYVLVFDESKSSLQWGRVLSTELIRPTKDGTFGGVCPGGRVYNLEVSGVHNYFADGVLVHNCHHASAYTWYKLALLCPAQYRWAMSGTLSKGKLWEDVKLRSVVGKTIAKMSEKDLWNVGVLAKPEIYVINDSSSYDARAYPYGSRNYNICVDTCLTNDVRYNKSIAYIAKYLVGIGKPPVIFTRHLKHVRMIAKSLERYGVPYKTLKGANSIDARNHVKLLYAKKLNFALVVTSIFDEGENVNAIPAVILAGGGKGTNVQVRQRIGRGMRKKSGDNRVIVFDFMHSHCTMLHKHAKERLSVYRDKQMKVTMVGNVKALSQYPL